MLQALLVFAFDGSGVPLRALVDLVGDPVDGHQLVHPVNPLPDWSDHVVDNDGNVLANVANLDPVGSSPRLASFNWLD